MGLTRLSRYLLREVLLAWLAVTVVLFVVLLTNRLVQFMADAASGDIPAEVIFTLLGLKAAANLGVVLPGSFFLGVVLALGRLYRDSEMTAMAGCGIGPWPIYRGILAVALPLALLVGALTLTLGPAAERQADRVVANAEQTVQFQGLQPGQFLGLGGDTTVYVATITDEGRMSQVFAERQTADGREIWVAAAGRRAVDEVAPGEFLVLSDGYRYRGEPGQSDWQLLGYDEYGVRLSEPDPIEPGIGLDARPLGEVLDAADPRARAELAQRLSYPLMVFVLALGALPLARTGPRSGRYGRVVIAVLIFMIYFNLLIAVSDWAVRSAIPVWAGVGGVHLVALAVVLAGLSVRLGIRWRGWAPQ
ncbi:MAG: LPS export ABC transporter permease LptF [Spiribacter sp.]|nr:LPS export ABC transporter permease LptF [Spiribacter sp.]